MAERQLSDADIVEAFAAIRDSLHLITQTLQLLANPPFIVLNGGDLTEEAAAAQAVEVEKRLRGKTYSVRS
jgi:hypothetical protein